MLTGIFESYCITGTGSRRAGTHMFTRWIPTRSFPLAHRIAPANTRILWRLQFGCNLSWTFVKLVHWRCYMRHSRRYTDGGPRRRPLLHCGAQSHSLAHDLGIELGNGLARLGGERRGRGAPSAGWCTGSCTAPPDPTDSLPPRYPPPPTLLPF